MLFQGIREEELGVWKDAEERATEDVARWSKVVGVDEGKWKDETLFRVLEWGGMEVVKH
jgi:hypothetical protein